jgi:acetolactate synthase-1/2/3 large subunit
MLAESFGIKGIRISELNELEHSLDEMLNTNGPVIVDLRIEKEENCFPMIPSGAAHNEMILSADDDINNTSDVGLALV